VTYNKGQDIQTGMAVSEPDKKIPTGGQMGSLKRRYGEDQKFIVEE
jgi:hypothetical protein